MFTVIFYGYNTNVNKQTFVLTEGKHMNMKRLLRFYYCAESLDRAFDNIILRRACESARSMREGGEIAEELCKLIEKRRELAVLWERLDGVLGEMDKGDAEFLERYAGSREGMRSFGDDGLKRIRRLTAKISRRLSLDGLNGAVAVLDGYYCLLSAVKRG